MIYVWLTILALSLIIEYCHVKVVFFWFAFGALGASIFAGFEFAWYYQFAMFFGLSGLMLWLLRKPTLFLLERNSKRRLALSIIGKEFVLLTPIKLNRAGTIKVGNEVCDATTEDNSPIAENTEVKVVGFKNNKIIVENAKSQEK